MSFAHDPRPAARYPAVTPTSYREHLGIRAMIAEPISGSRAPGRVLRRLPAQLLRLALG